MSNAKQEYYVWQEVSEDSRGRGAFEKAVSLPLTQEMAKVVQRLLEVEHPDKLFATSLGKPISARFGSGR